MINQIYRLVTPKKFEVVFEDSNLTNNVIVRPTLMSICKADQRYYTGTRGERALKQKLPMALVHESIGEVVYDPTETFSVGQPVAMIPNIPHGDVDEIVPANYLKSSHFRSSGFDGFMQDYVVMNPNRLINLPENLNSDVSSFLELISVAMHNIYRFTELSHKRRDNLGVWGTGALGYITALILKYKFPEAKIFIMGRTDQKLDYFSFVDGAYNIDDIPDDFQVDHAFECVGGQASESAVKQIIEKIKPIGAISLMGVSEHDVEIPTRLVLEKGLLLFGTSRSERNDFENSIKFLEDNPKAFNELNRLIGNKLTVHNLNEVIAAFESDLTQYWGKTVISWKM